MKKVYTVYQTPQPNGAYFYVADYADDYPTDYPQTEVAIPDEIKDGLPKFNWHDNSWHDASEEGQAKLLSDLQKDNTQLKSDLQVEQNARIAAESERDTLTQAVKSLGLQVAMLTAQNTKPTEVTENV